MSKTRSKRPAHAISTGMMTGKEVRTSAKRSGMRRPDDEWQQMVWKSECDCHVCLFGDGCDNVQQES